MKKKKEQLPPPNFAMWEKEKYSFFRPHIAVDDPSEDRNIRGDVFLFEAIFDGVPFLVFKQILSMFWLDFGEQAFIDLLNEPTTSHRHIITFFEKEFRANECRTPKSPFFSRSFDWPFVKAKTPCAFMPKGEYAFFIELSELSRWAKRNPDILPHDLEQCKKNLEKRRIAEQNVVIENDVDMTALKAENEALKARVAELEKAAQNVAGRGKKAIDPREKKTLLKLIHAALLLDKKKSIDDRSLASLLAAKTENLYPMTPVNNDTAKKKLNEIMMLHKKESE